MKILQINKFYYLRGGSERYFLNLSKLLEKNGHTVVPFSVKNKRNLPSDYDGYFAEEINLDKFSVKNIFKIFYNWDALKKLEKLLKQEHFDVAHLHNIAHQLSPSIISLLRRYNIPVVQTLHDYKLICPNYKLFSKNEVCYKCQGGKYYNCFARCCVEQSYAKSFLAMLEAYWRNSILKTYDKVDFFISPSGFMRDVCVRFGIQEDRIKFLPNFIEQDKKLENKENNLKENYIFYFGRLTKEKGVGVLLSALSMIDDSIRLKIAGDGPEMDFLKKKSLELKIDNRVDFLGGVYGDDLNNLIRRAKMVVVPSIWPENLPYTVLESFLQKTPIVASRLGGLIEMVKDGVDGYLFRANDSLDLAEKINNVVGGKLADDDDKYSLNKFFEKDHLLKILEIYQQAIDKKK